MKRYRVNQGARKLCRTLRGDTAGGVITEEALLRRYKPVQIQVFTTAGFLTEIADMDATASVRLVDETPADTLSSPDERSEQTTSKARHKKPGEKTTATGG